MTVVYAAAAVDEVAKILLALAAESSTAADKLQARLRQAERQIETYPSSGGLTFTRGTAVRRIVLRPYRYVLFYRVEGDEILVIGVRHGARDPSTMPGKAPDDLP